MLWHDIYEVAWVATWGNNTAWLESLIIASVAVYVFRDRIGRKLIAWLHKHHQAHLERLAAAPASPDTPGATEQPAGCGRPAPGHLIVSYTPDTGEDQQQD